MFHGTGAMLGAIYKFIKFGFLIVLACFSFRIFADKDSGTCSKLMQLLLDQLNPIDLNTPWIIDESNRDIVPVVVVIIQNKNQRILMSRRMNDEQRSPRLSLPGGKLDQGDSFIKAAIREVWEETGIQVEKQDLSFLTKTIGLHADPDKAKEGKLVLVVVLKATSWRNSPFNREGLHKMDKLGFYDLSKLPESQLYDPQGYGPEVKKLLDRPNLATK
jgi:8-oxo-dGTP diphosphatase